MIARRAILRRGRDDIRITMPPHPWRFDGWPPSAPCWRRGSPGRASGACSRPKRQPAAASYLRATGDSEFRAFRLDMLRSRAA